MKHCFLPYLSIVIVFGIVVSACQRPKNVLDRKKMESLMYDVYIAEALMDNNYSTFNSPEKKEAFINSIFEKHRTTQAQWDTSLVYYSDKIDVYLRMNDSVKARIQRQQKELENNQQRILTQNQAIDQRITMPSYIPHAYSFAQADIRQGFRFRLDSTITATQIIQDQFDFSFDVIGIPPTAQTALKSVLMLEYKDTTIYQANDISQNQPYKITASKFIPNDTLKTISGFVRLNSRYEQFRGILLYNIHLGSLQIDAEQGLATTELQDTIKGRQPIQMDKMMNIDTLERATPQ